MTSDHLLDALLRRARRKRAIGLGEARSAAEKARPKKAGENKLGRNNISYFLPK